MRLHLKDKNSLFAFGVNFAFGQLFGEQIHVSPQADLIFPALAVIVNINAKLGGETLRFKWAHCGLARMDGPALVLIV